MPALTSSAKRPETVFLDKVRKLRGFNVDRLLLEMINSSFIKSIYAFAMICLFGYFSRVNENAIDTKLEPLRGQRKEGGALKRYLRSFVFSAVGFFKMNV